MGQFSLIHSFLLLLELRGGGGVEGLSIINVIKSHMSF